MKQILLMIAVVALVGCGKKTTPSEPETNAEPKVAANKPEPAKTEPKPEAKIPANAFVNTLGMPFVPVPGTEVQFCIWETRVKDYAAYAAANAGVDGSWKRPGFSQTDTHPVVKVSWNDAQAFCEWLTKKELAAGKIKEGQKYRLPTDAEWSVAVGLGNEKGKTPKEKKRNGIKGVYPWGKEWPPAVGAGNFHKYLKVDKFDYTAPAGSFAANQHGLHDMGGNVWEWCEDWYDPAAKARRVLRGASWLNGLPDDLLSSYRYGITPGGRSFIIGFRCVLVGGSGG
jgi:formylglycine-generating enzyme required for sulfatase activity